MEIGSRIKLLRKELDLKQSEFAERIGLKQAAIGLYENGDRNVTDRNIDLICERYNVSESWLRDGVGEMFNVRPTELIDQIADEYNLSAMSKTIVSEYLNLSEPERVFFESIVKKLFNSGVSAGKYSSNARYDNYQIDDESDEVLDAESQERLNRMKTELAMTQGLPADKKRRSSL